MEIEPPPPPASPDTGKIPRRGRSFLAVLLLWMGILLMITLIAWVALWSGGVKEATPASGTKAAQAEAAKTEQR